MISHMESNLSFQEYQNHIKFMRENHGREIIARIIDEELIFDRDGLYYENGRTDLINENSNIRTQRYVRSYGS